MASPAVALATAGDLLARGTVYPTHTYSGHPNYFGTTSIYNTVDIPIATGTAVYAPEDGSVTNVSAGDGWGIQIVWRSANGSERIHVAHLSQVVKTGAVNSGDLIARSGSTGNSTGPHMHVDRSVNGVVSTVVLSGVAIAPYIYPSYHYYTSAGPLAGGNPKGAFDLAASEQPGTVRVAGWDFDPNVPTQAIDYHVYIGGPAGSAGAEGFAFTANAVRADVGAAYPGVGNNHGYDRTIVTSKRGSQSVYVYAINAPGTPGTNVLLGTKTVTIANPDPRGAFDTAASQQPGTVRVTGWDFDPNVPTQAIDVHVYIGGPAGSAGAEGYPFTANGSRPDVNAVFPGVGNNHGYDVTITTSKRGTQSVYVYAINAPGTPGNNVLLGSKTVTIASPPTAITLSAPSTCDYGSGTLKGVLMTGAGDALADKVLSVELSYDNSTWTALNQVTTAADGGFVLAIAPTQKTSYRVGFAGDASYVGCTSGTKTVIPRVYLTTPSAPRTACQAHAFTSTGYLKPLHTAGTYPTRLQCYRYQSGKWVLRKSVTAKASNYSSYTKYARSLSLPYRGKWRIRAYHMADSLNAATYSSYRFLTVK